MSSPTVCTARPSAPPEVIEAPPELISLFHEWLASGCPPYMRPEFEVAMYPYRRRYLLAARHVFWLQKFGRFDAIRFGPRWCVLPAKSPAGLRGS